MITGTSSGADDVIGNGKCVLSGHLREAIWMIASNKTKTFHDPHSPNKHIWIWTNHKKHLGYFFSENMNFIKTQACLGTKYVHQTQKSMRNKC